MVDSEVNIKKGRVIRPSSLVEEILRRRGSRERDKILVIFRKREMQRPEMQKPEVQVTGDEEEVQCVERMASRL